MLRTHFSRTKPSTAIAETDVTTAHNAARAGLLRLIDVREPSEFAAGHPTGAVNLPLNRLPAAIDQLPDGPIAVTCGSGVRSFKAARAAQATGRDDVQNVTGGFRAWQKAGLPTRTRHEPAR